MNCVTCLHCSLDGVICHLHHRPTEPTGTCGDHTDGGEDLAALRNRITKECTKKNV